MLKENLSCGRLNYWCQVLISLEQYYAFTSLPCLIVRRARFLPYPVSRLGLGLASAGGLVADMMRTEA